MLGASSGGLQFNQSRNDDDRFYSVSRNKKKENHHQKSDDVSSSRPVQEGCKPAASCNLERFLESVTPSVPAQYLSKMTMRSYRTCDVEYQPYFVLSDLWESFKEWSAYGVGVPLMMNSSDNVVQYYVPYLSGVQLYADTSKSTSKSGRLGDESDEESYKDLSSEGSSDSEQDFRGGLNYSQRKLNHLRINNQSLEVDKLSLRDQALQEGFSSDEGESGCLLFEYFARDQPYCREPLADKISDLSRHFPELKTLRSCDLLPSSWISVAWYPIYRIPTGPTLKDLDACFLTFHSLHTPITGREVVHPPIVTYPSEGDYGDVPQISLPVFGLASYKYKASLWTPNMRHQNELTNSLLQSADNWLNLLRVDHPDFSFFCRR